MDEPKVPRPAKALSQRFAELRLARRKRKLQRQRRGGGSRRRQLTKGERSEILQKTDARCHLCGGRIKSKWQADHVLAHSSGGGHAVDNYLPAHRLCNNYRWDYSPEEFQWILKIGVWARTQMERDTRVGSLMMEKFLDYELRRQKQTNGKTVTVAGRTVPLPASTASRSWCCQRSAVA